MEKWNYWLTEMVNIIHGWGYGVMPDGRSYCIGKEEDIIKDIESKKTGSRTSHSVSAQTVGLDSEGLK